MIGLRDMVSALGWLAHIAIDVVFVVISLTIVRKHRPDAALLLAGGAGVSLVTMLGTWMAYTIGPRIVPSASLVGAMPTFYTAVALGSSMMGVLGQILIIAGVVRLARPERTVSADPGRYE